MDYKKDFIRAKEDTNGEMTKNQYLRAVAEVHGLSEMEKATKQLQRIKE